MLDGKTVIDGVVYHVIVIRVVDLLIHNGLEIRVLGGIDGKSSGIQKIGGLGFCVAQAHRKYDSHSKKDQNQLHKP